MPIIPSVTSSLTRGLTQDLFKSTGPAAISNSKSLAFDGSDQHLTTTADGTLATKTYSWWSQSADTGINGIFDHGAYNIGAFFFNYSSNKPLLYLESNWFRYWNDTSCQDDGSWHHWLLLLHTNISNCRLFCDGVEQTVQSTATGAGAGSSYTTDLRIGRAGTNYFSGHLDEFAVFDGDKTGIVADLYNSGVPTNLASTAGLEHWWRMGDATEPAADGTNDLIFDQQDKTLGSELVTNGDYETGDFTGWTLFGADTQTVEVATNAAGSNAAHLVTDGTYASVYQALTPASGTVVKLTFDVQIVTGTLVVSDGTDTTSYGTSGSYVRYITSDGHIALEFKRSAGATEFYVDNVSVKEVNGATATMANMASSDIVQYTPNSHILSDLGITPDLAVSMTRKLVSDYSGSFYATSGSDVTTVYDQSGNSRNLTNDSTTNATLSGSGNAARAVFASSGYTVLTTGTAGSSFPAGAHDIFIVFDPVDTDKQMLLTRGTQNTDRLTMQVGSSSNVFDGVTRGDVRVDDVVLPSQDRGNLEHYASHIAGLHVISVEDLVLSTMGGNVMLGVPHTTWRVEGSFAEFIITPPLTDAEHSAVVENIRAHYST